MTGSATRVRAATLLAPRRLEVREYPYPAVLEPGAVLLRMLASGICGTDKHTFRGETRQYVGTEYERTTPFPIIQGHENLGVVAELGSGGASAFDGTPLTVGDRVVPAPNPRLWPVSHVRSRLSVLPVPERRELRELA